VRQAAADALASKTDGSVVEALLGALHDRDETVRLAVVQALGKSNSSRAMQALIDIVTEHVSESEAGMHAPSRLLKELETGLGAKYREFFRSDGVRLSEFPEVFEIFGRSVTRGRIAAAAVAALEESSDPAVATPRVQEIIQAYKAKLARQLEQHARSSSPKSTADRAMLSSPRRW
jgi:HEAT repeat protein